MAYMFNRPSFPYKKNVLSVQIGRSFWLDKYELRVQAPEHESGLDFLSYRVAFGSLKSTSWGMGIPQ